MSTRSLPRAGMAFGRYPERRLAQPHPLRDPWRTLASWFQRPGVARLPGEVAQAAAEWQSRLSRADEADRSFAHETVRAALMREGFAGIAAGQAIGLVSAAMRQQRRDAPLSRPSSWPPG